MLVGKAMVACALATPTTWEAVKALVRPGSMHVAYR